MGIYGRRDDWLGHVLNASWPGYWPVMWLSGFFSCLTAAWSSGERPLLTAVRRVLDSANLGESRAVAWLKHMSGSQVLSYVVIPD